MDTHTYNDSCAICFEADDLFQLSCGHNVHLTCASNMISTNCPMCGQMVTNFSTEVLENIAKSQRSYQEKRDEEERQSIQNEEEQRRENAVQLELILQPDPNLEILTAHRDLIRQGVPSRFIPTSISINTPVGHSRPPAGTWYSTIMGQAISRMKESMIDDTTSYSSSDLSDSDDETLFDTSTNLEETLSRVTIDDVER